MVGRGIEELGLGLERIRIGIRVLIEWRRDK